MDTVKIRLIWRDDDRTPSSVLDIDSDVTEITIGLPDGIHRFQPNGEVSMDHHFLFREVDSTR